jgi:hypothetical protein
MRFHIQGKSMMSDTYTVTDAKLKNLVKSVLKALQPIPNKPEPHHGKNT